MVSTTRGVPSTLLDTFYRVAAYALARAEHSGRMPERFAGRGIQRWTQFANELTMADLLDLAVMDAAAAYPVPFGLRNRLPGFDDGKPGLDPAAAERLVKEAMAAVEQSTIAYLNEQAQRLGIDLPAEVPENALPTSEPHQRVLELPGTGGWLAYQVLSQAEGNLYLHENVVIACGRWQEAMLAGLVALELDAPPNKPLPVTEAPLLDVLQKGRWDWVVGLRALSGHLALGPFVPSAERVVLL